MTSSAKIRRAYLFNFEKFDDSRMDRKNTSQDINRLKDAIPIVNSKCLINFTVYANNQLTKKNLDAILNRIAQNNHQRDKYLLFLFSSHGDGNGILTVDMQMFAIENILKKFTNCPVPTIFIFQACRGRTTDNGVETFFPKKEDSNVHPLIRDQLQTSTSVSSDSWHDSFNNFMSWFTNTAKPLERSVSVQSTLKTIAMQMPQNSVVAFSTSPGRFSWRAKDGGVFLQDLTAAIKLFQELKKPLDIIKLLKFTNHKVGSKTYNYLERDARSEQTQEQWVELKQIGEVLSTLIEPLLLFWSTEHCTVSSTALIMKQ